MSGERSRRTTTSRDNREQQRVSSLPPSLVPHLREPPSASLDDDEHTPALPSPHYEPSRPVLPSMATSQPRPTSNLRQQPLLSFRESPEASMRPTSASADTDDEEQHHDRGGLSYRREVTSHVRATPQPHRQPHQSQSRSSTPLSAPIRPHSALDTAYLSEVSNVSATSSARGAPPPSHTSTGTSSDSSVPSARSRRRAQERDRSEHVGHSNEPRPTGLDVVAMSRETLPSGYPDVEYEPRTDRRTRFPVSTMRGSNRVYTPPTTYSDPTRTRGTRSRDDEAEPNAWSDSEQDLHLGSSARLRGREHWYNESRSSLAAPSPTSPQLRSAAGQYPQDLHPSVRHRFTEDPAWTEPPTEHNIRHASRLAQQVSGRPGTVPHHGRFSASPRANSDARDATATDSAPMYTSSRPGDQGRHITTSLRETASASSLNAPSAAASRYPDYDPRLAHESRHDQYRTSPPTRGVLSHLQYSRHSSSPPPPPRRDVESTSTGEERAYHQERHAYIQGEYYPQSSRGIERASPHASPRMLSSSLPPLRPVHSHYQPHLQEHQLAGPTARMQELTLLQRSPRVSHSAPGQGYYSGSERGAPALVASQSTSSRHGQYNPVLSSSYPGRDADLPPPGYLRRDSPTIYEAAGQAYRPTPAPPYGRQADNPSSSDLPPVAKRARKLSHEGSPSYPGGQLSSPTEGESGPPGGIPGESARGRMSIRMGGMSRSGGRSTPASTSASRSGTRTPLEQSFPPRELRIAPAVSFGRGLELSLGTGIPPAHSPGPPRRIGEQVIHPQLLQGQQGGPSRDVGEDTDGSEFRGEDGSPRPLFVVGSAREGSENRSRPPRPKIEVACDFCRKRKMRCDGMRPSCSHCNKRQVACTYITEVRRRGPGKKKKLVAERPKKTNKAIESGTAPVAEKKQGRGKGKAREEFEEGSSQQFEGHEQLHLPQSPSSESYGHPGLLPNANTDLFLPSMIQSESSGRHLTYEASAPYHPQQFPSASASFSPSIVYYRSPQGFAPELYPPGRASPPFSGADVLDPVLSGEGGNAVGTPMYPDPSSSSRRRASTKSSGPSSSGSEATRKSGRSRVTKRARMEENREHAARSEQLGTNEGDMGAEAGPSSSHGRSHGRRTDEDDEVDELADDET